MSLQKSLRYFLRLNQHSIQGKFTVLFISVAVIVGALFLYNYKYLIAHQQHQHRLLHVWQPTSSALEEISLRLETGALDSRNHNELMSRLNALASNWQNERLLIYQESLLEQLEGYIQRTENTDQAGEAAKQLPEYKQLQKVIMLMTKESASQVQEHEAAEAHFATAYKKLLIIQYICFLIFGSLTGYWIIDSVLSKVRGLKSQVANIAKGYLSDTIKTRQDEFYSISRSLNQLIQNLKEMTYFAAEVGRGNMDVSINAFEQESELGNSLSEMRDSLKKVAHEDKNRRWLNEGVAKFAELLRQHNNNSSELSTAVVGELVKYLGALQGALFITQQEGSKTVLQMSGCYAYDRQKFLNKQIPADSGLIGQAYLEKAPKYLKEIPKNYDTITTGLGQGSPESIVMVPLLHDDRVEGVLEIASLRQLEEHELSFLYKITESLGAAIASVRISDETRRLLEESQGVAEEMRAQEEEMRQNMEEMQATQEEMLRAQKALSIKETNLHAFINNTSDSIITITRDYKVGLINDVLKSRYKGTPYEGIDEGTDLLPTLGSVADEWKGYYDRAFSGERLDFILKSSVEGEDSWREYIINPIKAKNGEIVAASVLSRDVTDKVKQENSLQQKSAILQKITEHKADAYLALDPNSRIIVASSNIKDMLPALVKQPKEGDRLTTLLTKGFSEEWQLQLENTLQGHSQSCKGTADAGEAISIHSYPVFADKKEVIAVLVLAVKL